MTGDGVLDVILNGYNGAAFARVMYGGSVTTTSTTGALSAISLLTQSSATQAMSTISTVSDTIAMELGNVAAQRSRLGASAEMALAKHAELENAREKIVSVDVAFEVAEMLRWEIVQRSATAILAQANQISGRMLSLLV